jgi:hypothetical protein
MTQRFDLHLEDGAAARVRAEAEAAGVSVSSLLRHRVSIGRETGPYRFEGFHGDSLVRDLVVTQGWSKGESRDTDDAFARLQKFQRWAADVSFAPITTAGASAVIPPGYESVAGLTLQADRPLFNACEHGSIRNSAPFTIPRVASSDAVVPASRAEGAQPSGSDPSFGSTSVSPIGLSGLVDITRELADSASPAGDLVMLRLLAEDWGRRAEEKIYAELNSTNGAGGTITSGFVPSGAMAFVSSTPTTGLLTDLRKQLLRFANVRRRRPRNTILGAAAADYLGGLLVDESGSDEQAVARVAGSKVNVSAADFATGAADARILTLSADDVFVFTSPIQEFRFDEQSGPGLVRIAIWAYIGVAIVRARGISAVRFT